MEMKELYTDFNSPYYHYLALREKSPEVEIGEQVSLIDGEGNSLEGEVLAIKDKLIYVKAKKNTWKSACYDMKYIEVGDDLPHVICNLPSGHDGKHTDGTHEWE